MIEKVGIVLKNNKKFNPIRYCRENGTNKYQLTFISTPIKIIFITATLFK
mgnify:CR=1 FL=1